ncbi:unnamed protein product [Mytilus coruscus]|uniref:Uncharacterized protein n=1 Tax=Mytilus coruscus TaxID=42192 RepID=A0A6J8ANQ7_MYTCO|nr:unnamed protein product [Mytilus coruscus]
MSGRKRPARHDPNDPMHWNKEQYVTHLKNMGISVKSTWRLDMIRQLYFVNQKDIENSTQKWSVVSPEPNSSKIDEVTVAADEQPSVDTDQHTNENSTISRTEEMLKDSTSALKSANEAMSAMSSMVVGLLANKDSSSSSSNSLSNPKSNFDFASAYQATYGNNTQISSANAEQTFHRQVDTSKGIVFAEDLPKLDYVSTSLRKQILEDVPERSSGSRCTSHDLSALLTRNVELTNSVSCLLKTSIAPRTQCNVSIEDIRFLKDKVTFHLKASKTDPFREGVDIHLFASGASVCPVLSLERYMEFRNRKFKDSKTQDAFFVMENRKALTRNYFISSLKRYLPYLDTIQTYIMVTAFALEQVPQQVQKLKITLFRHSDGGVHSVILDI